MASKVKIATIPVVKHKVIELRELGTRMSKEFAAEIAADVAAGFKVVRVGKRPGDGKVVIEMGKTEEWTLEEFLAEVHEKLDGCC